MKTVVKLSGLVIVLSLLLLVASHFLMHSASHVSHFITQHHSILQYWHYALYVLILLFWPVMVQKVGELKHWPPERILLFSNQRLKLVALFIVIDVFFVNNLLGYILSYL